MAKQDEAVRGRIVTIIRERYGYNVDADSLLDSILAALATPTPVPAAPTTPWMCSCGDHVDHPPKESTRYSSAHAGPEYVDDLATADVDEEAGPTPTPERDWEPDDELAGLPVARPEQDDPDPLLPYAGYPGPPNTHQQNEGRAEKCNHYSDCEHPVHALATPPPIQDEAVRERLAAIEHDQWIEWSRTIAAEGLTPERIERWQRYWVPYDNLDEPTKDHDRKWADKVLAALATPPPVPAAPAALWRLQGEYVVDRDGLVWRVVRDGGMATRADFTGIESIGIEALRSAKGPLAGLNDFVDAAAGAVPAAPGLQEAVEGIENVLTGMDWISTGSSQKAADDDEHKAWQQWGVILSALGDNRDPHKRVYETGGDPRVAVPAAPGLDVERLARFGFEEHHRDQGGLTRTWKEAPDYSKNVWRRWAQSVLARLSPDQKEDI